MEKMKGERSMAIQKNSWGQIEWIDDSLRDDMSVGIVTLNVGAHQYPHLHYEEQVIYVIQGQAVSILDGVESNLKPGMFFHWPAGVIHEIYNLGNVAFQHFLISNPVDEKVFKKKKRPKVQTSEDLNSLLYFAIESIKKQYLENLNYAYTIFDKNGNVLLQSSYSPTFCNRTCARDKGGVCSCIFNSTQDFTKECNFYCEKGMKIFSIPIYYDEIFLGYIEGGYVYQSEGCPVVLNDVYDTPESTAHGIRKLLRRIAHAIEDFCEFEEIRRDLYRKDMEINDSKVSQLLLLQDLQNAENQMTDLKINNHFLFNTLNGMASMAIEQGAIDLYQSIVDLSKMFHYTLRTQESIVTVKKEVDYVKAYLKLQKLRYGEDLKVEYEMDSQIDDYQVPFNFLQPIVENAFVHGFDLEKEKKIVITIREEDKYLKIKIHNTGKVLDLVSCNRINKNIRSSRTHGSGMIYKKLESNYGDDFVFKLLPDKGLGMQWVVQIPKRREKEEL